MKLYNYFRSSASFRVRIALHLKGLAFDYVPVHLAKGEQKTAGFAALSADRVVPLLELDDGTRIAQSMAIIEYLHETQPGAPLLPPDPLARAQVRALAQMVVCEIHPLNNLRVLQYLKGPLGHSEEAKNTWYHHWTRNGLEALERQLAALAAQRQQARQPESRFCWGDAPTLADCCLVPQLFSAQRFGGALPHELPRVMAVYQACMALPAFQKAQPSACPDFEP